MSLVTNILQFYTAMRKWNLKLNIATHLWQMIKGNKMEQRWSLKKKNWCSTKLTSTWEKNESSQRSYSFRGRKMNLVRSYSFRGKLS